MLLAEGGAFDSFDLGRRDAVWQAREVLGRVGDPLFHKRSLAAPVGRTLNSRCDPVEAIEVPAQNDVRETRAAQDAYRIRVQRTTGVCADKSYQRSLVHRLGTYVELRVQSGC